jgi:adenylate cyclase
MMIKSNTIITKYVLEREKILNLDVAQEIAKSTANVTSFIRERTTTIANNLSMPPAFTSIVQSAEKDFRNNLQFISLEIWKNSATGPRLEKNLINTISLEKFGFDQSYYDNIDRIKNFPLAKAFAGEVIVKNSSLSNGVPMISIGYPFRKNDAGEIQDVVVVDIDPQVYTEAFSGFSSRKIYVVDPDGRLIAYNAASGYSIKDELAESNPTLQYALSSTTTLGQKDYINPTNKENVVTAFARTPAGLLAFTEVDSSVVTKPARQLKRDITYIALSVISLSLLVLMFVSSRFTKPIEQISLASSGIAKGDFDVNFQSPGNDEISDLCTSLNHMVLGLKERERARTVLHKFHGEKLTEKLMTGDLSRKGHRVNAAILFIDMRNFTSYSENSDPEDVVKTINAYFDFMVNIIHRYDGTPDKFIGDALMAVWGLDGNLDCNQPVKAALEIRAKLEEFNMQKITNGENPIYIGMGLNCGEVVSGIIGAEARLEYTVIGNAVNVASRVQDATKKLGLDLLISDSIAEKLSSDIALERVGEIMVRGVSHPIITHSVIGFKDKSGAVHTVTTPYSKYTPGV